MSLGVISLNCEGELWENKAVFSPLPLSLSLFLPLALGGGGYTYCFCLTSMILIHMCLWGLSVGMMHGCLSRMGEGGGRGGGVGRGWGYTYCFCLTSMILIHMCLWGLSAGMMHGCLSVGELWSYIWVSSMTGRISLAL